MSVVIETTLGDVTVDLFTDERPQIPTCVPLFNAQDIFQQKMKSNVKLVQTCLNFLKLCKIKYYNMCLFHSVTENFLAQTGDPTGKGDGGESIYGLINGKQHRLYQGEKSPRIKHNQIGLLSMVSHGNNLFGSQFVITLSDDLSSLDQEHCVFGLVVEGDELLRKLNEVITDSTHRPYQDVRITHTVILEDPFPDPEGLLVPPQSPSVPGTKDAAYSRIPADEPINENYNQQELDEMVQQREAAARATILEMVGDLPDADAAPPENVLFVCKLNPVTTDHDLSIIFSRFGLVKSCEVIRDQVSGDSLQYAFVEFENRKACEDAYFKMDNVLIDDRRIHVDFSQSVAKLKWKGKGKGVIHLDEREKERKNEFLHHKDIKQEKNYQNVRNFHHGQYRNNRELQTSTDRPRYDRRTNNRIKEEPRNRIEKRVKKRRSKTNKKKRVTSSSESSSDSSSSLDSTDSEYRKKKSRSRKVLVVVKTPRSMKSQKKLKKSRSRKYASDSEEVKRKRKRKKTRKQSTETSSDDSQVVKKKKKLRKRESSSSSSSMSSSEEETVKRKRKRKKSVGDSSDSFGDVHKNSKSRTKKRKVDSVSSSDSEQVKRKRRKLKNKQRSREVRKIKKKRKSLTETTSSTD